MPDSDIPLQPEVPRPIPRDEAEINEQEAWVDPNEVYQQTQQRPTYQRQTYQQPTYQGRTYQVPGTRTPLRGCQMLLIALMLLFLLGCCLCNNMTSMFSTPTSGYSIYDYGY